MASVFRSHSVHTYIHRIYTILPAKHLSEKFNCVLLRHEAHKTGPDIMVLLVGTFTNTHALSNIGAYSNNNNNNKCMLNTLVSFVEYAIQTSIVWHGICFKPLGTSSVELWTHSMKVYLIRHFEWSNSDRLNCTSRSYTSDVYTNFRSV